LISSSVALERFLNNDIYAKTDHLISKADKKIKLFVQNKSFGDVVNILKKHQIAVISGEPGVGKTTLAEMVLCYFIGKKFRPIAVTSANEAYQAYDAKKPTIYYFDDFLGTTFLGDNYDDKEVNQIVELIDLVQSSKNSIIIMTSREYILKQAFQESERLCNSNFLDIKYRLEISEYTKAIRAKILYNHLFYSEIDNQFIEEMVSTKTYNQIIQHPNYSPRIIELMTKNGALQTVNPKDYPNVFLNNLDNPKSIWEHAFTKYISNRARNLLWVLLSLGGTIASKALEQSFRTYHSYACTKYNRQPSATDYNEAVAEILGSFITTNGALVLFANPSVKDFLEDLAVKNQTILIDCLYGASSLKQIQNIWKLCKKSQIDLKDHIVKAMLRLQKTQSINNLTTIEKFSLYLEIYKNTHNEDLLKIINDALKHISQKKISFEHGTISDWVDLGLSFIPLNKTGVMPYETFNFIKTIIKDIVSEAHFIEDFSSIIDALNEALIDNHNKKAIQEDFLNYLSHKIDDEMTEKTHLREMEIFVEYFEEVALFFNINDEALVGKMHDYLNELEENDERYNSLFEDEYKEKYYEEKHEQKDIDRDFSRLIER